MKPILFFLCILGSFASSFSTTTIPVVLPSNKRQTSITKMSPYDPSTKSGHVANSMAVRGGGLKAATADSTGGASGEASKCPFSKFIQLSSSLYGTTGVMYILIKAIRRVYPIALEPFAKGGVPLTQFQLGYVVIIYIMHHVVYRYAIHTLLFIYSYVLRTIPRSCEIQTSSYIINSSLTQPLSIYIYIALTSPLAFGLPTWKDTRASKPSLLLLSSPAL
jgi:hypothetical protein